MLINAKTTRRTSIFFSPKEAQLLFRQLQKLSAQNIAALKCESRKTKCWVPWNPPLMQLSVNKCMQVHNQRLCVANHRFGQNSTILGTKLSLHTSAKRRKCRGLFKKLSGTNPRTTVLILPPPLYFTIRYKFPPS